MTSSDAKRGVLQAERDRRAAMTAEQRRADTASTRKVGTRLKTDLVPTRNGWRR